MAHTRSTAILGKVHSMISFRTRLSKACSRQYDPVPSPNTTNGLSNGTVVAPYKGPNIGTFLEPFGKFDLLAYMNKFFAPASRRIVPLTDLRSHRFWIAQGQPNPDFWGHEFSKHATCFSTFDLPCYGPEYRQHEDVVDFFDTAVMYYMNLPTYGWLSAKNIRPSNTTAYSLSDMQFALSTGFGAVPYIGCSGPRYNETKVGNGTRDSGRTYLSEVWYYYHVYGRVQRGQGLPVNASINGGSISSCATTPGAIRYPLRSNGSEANV